MKSVLNLTYRTSCLARWRFCLYEFNHNVVQRTSINRKTTNAISSLKTNEIVHTHLDDYIPILVIEKQ